MRILLVHPTYERWTRTPVDSEPDYAPFLGVNTLATVLEDSGHDVVVLDELAKWFMDKRSGYMDWLSRVLLIVEQEKIEVLGITVLTHFRALALRIAQEAKRVKPSLHVILGGPHATFAPEMLLQHYQHVVTAIVRGEGEVVFPLLVDRLRRRKGFSDLRGVVSSAATGSQPRVEGDIPIVRYDRYMKLSENKGFARGLVMATRGCPHHHCVFCTTQALRRVQLGRDLDDVVSEIRGLKDCNVRSLMFQDDVFFGNPIEIDSLFSKLDEASIEFDEHYAHCRSRDLTRELAQALRRTNRNWRFFIGLESGSPVMRRSLQKYLGAVTNETILQGVEHMHRNGISLGLFLIFGTPGERLSHIAETYQMVKKISPSDCFCGVLRIYPGTALAEQAVKEGIFRESDWYDKIDQPFFFYPQGDDYYQARAACELFHEWFVSERIRRHPEQSVDEALHRDTAEDRKKIDEWKTRIVDYVNPV